MKRPGRYDLPGGLISDCRSRTSEIPLLRRTSGRLVQRLVLSMLLSGLEGDVNVGEDDDNVL